MNRIVIVVMLFASIAILHAQSPPPITLSQSPTAQELNNIFRLARIGRIEPMNAISRVTERGDSAVSGLRQVVLSYGDPSDTSRIVKRFALLALDAIGTTRAFSTLGEVAQEQSDPQLRGVALSSLATTYYQKVVSGQV